MGELAEVSAGQRIKASHINDLIAAYTQLRDQGFVGQSKNSGGVNKIKIMCENLGNAVVPFAPVQLFKTADTYDYSILMGGTAPVPCQTPPSDLGDLVPLTGLAWGIAEDGLPKGGCGRVTIQGEVIAIVKGETTGNYADIASGEGVLSATTTQTRAEIIGRISTSNNDFCKILLGGGGGGGSIDVSSGNILDLSYTTVHQETSRGSTVAFDPENPPVDGDDVPYDAIKMTECLGDAYYSSGDKTWYQFQQDRWYHITSIGLICYKWSAERRVVINATSANCVTA
jgi:hypothetical protein